MEPAGRLSTGQLVDHLPSLYNDICALLQAAPDPKTGLKLIADAKKHGRDRWMLGYEFDALYRELILLQRCVQQSTREFFGGVAYSSAAQVRAHEIIEDLFSATIDGAIRQLVGERDARVAVAIGERDLALTAQRKSEERLRLAASAAKLGIFEWDVASQTGIWANARMYEITGQDEANGPMTCRDFVHGLVHPEDTGALTTQYMDARQHGGDFHAIFRILRIRDRAPRIVEMNGRFIAGDSPAACSFVGTLADSTRRTLAENALHEANRRKDTFLATLAHELRNPLAPIRNAARLIGRRGPVGAKEVEWAGNVIERQCVHLTRLIDDLLDVSRINSGKISLRREIFDIREAIRGAVEINAPHASEHRHSIKVDLPEHSVPVNGDLTRLTQVFSNLLDNALKYSDDGTPIIITAEVDDTNVQVAVCDQGCGIPAAQLAHMFEPYVQLDQQTGRVQSGLGIGLTVVRNLVGMHGGSVMASSEGTGKGSRLTVRLPVARTSQAPEVVVVEPVKPRGQRLRVLIVDDNRDAAESLAMLLEEHESRCVHDGKTAIAIAADFRPDVVILDIGLPDMPGHEVGRRLRLLPATAHTILVALSGFGTMDDEIRSREAGFARHFVKPVDPTAMIEFLRLRNMDEI